MFSLPEILNLFLSFSVVMLTSYVIGGDFSRRTIQNVLSIGTDKKSYYFSRLLVQWLLVGALFSGAGMIHIVCHLLWPQGDTDRQIAYLWPKLAIYMAVVLLQLLAQASVVNAVCYFVRNQLAAILFGIGMVYLEVIIHQAAETNRMAAIQALVDFLPTNVIKDIFAYAVYDRVFTGGFFLYGLSAVLIIVVGSTAGYVKFCYVRD